MTEALPVPPPPDPDRYIYCATCRRALEHETGPGVDRYFHGPAVARHLRLLPHPPVPKPITEIHGPIMVCDFCSVESVAWAYQCADQVTEDRKVAGYRQAINKRADEKGLVRHVTTRQRGISLVSSWGERWAACADCATLIQARDLLGLVGRVVERLPAKMTTARRIAATRATVREHYADMFATLYPGRGAITPTNPFGEWIFDD